MTSIYDLNNVGTRLMRRPTLPTIRISFGFSIGSANGNIYFFIAVNYDDEGDVGDVNDDGDNNDNIYTDDQEALDCLDRDGEAESDEENCVDERTYHLKSI